MRVGQWLTRFFGEAIAQPLIDMPLRRRRDVRTLQLSAQLGFQLTQPDIAATHQCQFPQPGKFLQNIDIRDLLAILDIQRFQRRQGSNGPDRFQHPLIL